MVATSILCRCGQSLRLPDRREVVAKCPSCGRKIDYIANDLPIHSLNKKAYKRLFREREEQPSERDRSPVWGGIVRDLAGALRRTALANLFWIFSGVCIAAMVGGCLYFFSQTFSPSDAQLDYEMAVEFRAKGRNEDACRLLEQVVERAPRSRWAVRARGMLAEMPSSGVGGNRYAIQTE